MAGGVVTHLVPRTVSLVSPKDDPRFGREDLSLADFREDHGSVLLGEPGMGKTKAFEEEARRVRAPKPVSASRFMRGSFDQPPDGPGTPSFIDGLDEARAGGGDPRAPLDRILARLEECGNPPFRLSCRAGSWLEAGDEEKLSSITADGPIRILSLNPLRREDVLQIVSRRRDNADEFMFEALEHGLEAFLWNPQLLGVLLDAVEAAGWPDSPRAAFENACRELSKERNPEHRDASRRFVQPSRDAVLLAAGRLSALLLLNGKEGWTVTDSDDPDTLSLRDVADEEGGTDRHALLAALKSGLFTGAAARRTPVHRLMAEFLGARYLDGMIRPPDGTTVRRVLSLLLGHDGIPVPDLRGLTAWLAALNPNARTTLLHADPVAVAFGGDATDFTPRERRTLITQLENSPRLPLVFPSSVALGALAGSREWSPIWELTSTPIRTDARQELVARLLAGFNRRLRVATADPGGARTANYDAERRALLRIVYDDTWRTDVRCEALDALDHLLADGPERSAALRGVLSDLEADRLADDNNELLGTLLAGMYPDDLPPEKIWDFAARPRRPGATAYSMFWHNLVDESRPEQLRQLLDALCERAIDLVPALAEDGFKDVVMDILTCGLGLFGDQASTSDLYRWFGLLDTHPQRVGFVLAHCNDLMAAIPRSTAASKIQDWLKSYETTRRKLILQDLAHLEPEIEERRFGNTVGLKFVAGEPSDDFRAWCLSSAVQLAEERPIAAIELLRWATWARDGWGPPLPNDEVARAVRDTPALRRWNRERLQADARREREDAERKAASAHRVRERQRNYAASIREHASELAAGRCQPHLLDRLARVYFDDVDADWTRGDPVATLQQRLDDDLVSATLAGFRKLLSRDDLPDLAETARMHGSGQFTFLALPFLAGLAEEERAGRDPLTLLDEVGLRRALGYYLVYGQHISLFARRTDRDSSEDRDEPVGGPRWYRRALALHPAAVADAIVAVHRAQVRMKATPDWYLVEMSRNPAYARVAPLAVPRMFSVFPSRCTEPQIQTLRVVLWAALDPQNLSAAEFAHVVRKRLRRREMDVAQPIQWLCAGLFVAREECLPALVAHLADGRDARIHHVVDFFVSPGNRFRGPLALDGWKAKELADLVRALGRRSQRYDPPDGVSMLSDRQVARLRAEPLLNRLIGALAERAEDGAAAALESLDEDPTLGDWRWELARARETQAERLRAAKHETPGLTSIQETLRGGPPATAADLAALALDTLDELAARIRDDSTNDWRQYWHRDPKTRQPVRPQHENDCRDALLSDLRLRLRPYEVDVQSEGQYADEKRADIRVASGSRIAIPVEIKKNSHTEVWRAVDEQLAAKYARAPESGGYGIYLVLWFGRKHMKVTPPRGRLPRTAAELKERLEEHLPAELRAKIGIVVIDVSPSGKYASAES